MRSGRSVLLLGSLLLAALWFWRRPASALVPEPAEPSGTLSPLPLVAVCAGIALASGLWFAIQLWGEADNTNATARAMTGGNPAQAATLMTRYGCAGCHTIPGVPGADGQVGGALSDLRKRVFIAGVLPNTANNLIDWIVEPQAHNPHAAMPASGITRAEACDIAAWLYSR